MDGILDRIDTTLERDVADPRLVDELHFDDDYWRQVDDRPRSCTHCGHCVMPAATSTGWTHAGCWQGFRCPGMLCGAIPAPR